MKPQEPITDKKLDLIDKHFRICNDMYLMGISGNIDERFERLVTEPNAARRAIDLLKSQYRKSEFLDTWTLLDIALFVAGITRFGRDWESVKSIIPHKSAPELSQFYYTVWK